MSVGLMLTGFLLGGIALIIGNWWLFWTSGGIVLVGGLLAVVTDIFRDVLLDPLHQDHADPHTSPIHRVVTTEAPEEVEPTLPGHGPQVRREPGSADVPHQGNGEEGREEAP